jgi:hypothetical protein
LAPIGADASLTEALALWTASLWESKQQRRDGPVPVFYIDGHRKPVYADSLIPRGLIGRTGKILGCRALVVLHDQEGHLLLATTHRGDQHLTIGLPAMLTRYEHAAGMARLKRIVVVREGMSAEFLAALAGEGRTMVTILRTDQYAGLESFQQVGEFVPLQVDQQGKVIREVALAQIALPLPEHPGQELEVRVALIRDLRRLVPKEPLSEGEDRPRLWDEKPDGTHEYWLDESWQATPLPTPPMEPKLIPIDISNLPDLLRLAEEVQNTKTPRILKRDTETVAVLMPVGSAVKPEKKPAPTKAAYDASLAAIGSWSDLDSDALIAHVYRARKEGSRPAPRA